MRRITRLIRAAAAAVTLCLSAGAALSQEGQPASSSYSAKEIRETKAEELFRRLSEPEAGRGNFAALQALIEKAKLSPADKDEIVKLGSAIAIDPKAPELRRWQTLYVLSGTGDPRVITTLAQALESDQSATVRGVAACALGALPQEEAKAALKKAATTEKDAEVQGWIQKGLGGELRPPAAPPAEEGGVALALPVVNQASAKAVLAGTHYSVVLVKDFLRIENTGGALQDVEFERYTPVIDEEQFVVARWFDAAKDDGATLPVQVTAVRADDEQNLVHTLKLPSFPKNQQVLVTITSVVARRERAAPEVGEGGFPIPKAEEYPAPVRAYLASTPMIDSTHRSIKRQAEVLLTRTEDALQFAHQLAEIMRVKSYAMTGQPDPGMPTSAVVLKYGGSCCGSAVCAAAIFRAAGIPAQVTYCPPPSYVHGIVRFYLNGYGWVRMDSTCGTGKMPLVQEDRDLGLVRLFDMPMKMEQVWHGYAWPYHNNDETGEYHFRAGGKECATVRFASKDKPDGMRVVGHVAKPFPHLEPGSWSTVLGMETMPTADEWKAMVRASRDAVVARHVGEINEVVRVAPVLEAHVKAARDFARQEAAKE